MNVLQVIQGPGGGAWAVVRHLCRGLVGLGLGVAGDVQVQLGLSYKRGLGVVAREEARGLGCPVFEYRLPVDFPGSYGLAVPPTARWVRRVESSHPGEPVVIHLHNGVGIGRLAATRWFARNGRRCVVTFHGIPPRDDPAVRPGRDWRLRVHGVLARRLHRCGATMVAVSRVSAAQLSARYGVPPESFAVVPNGVPAARRHRRRESGRPRVLVVGFLGALNGVKGWDVAVEACRLVRLSGMGVRLVIAGDGPDRRRVEAAARSAPEHVHYLGCLSSGAVSSFLDGLDVLVLPSKSEGMPMVILEAMAHGVPCVATRVAGVVEAAEGCGLLVEDRSAEAVAGAVLRLGGDERLRQVLSRRCVARHGKRFDLDVMVRRYLAIYRRLASSPGFVPCHGGRSVSVGGG